jgi:hypothetical protein
MQIKIDWLSISIPVTCPLTQVMNKKEGDLIPMEPRTSKLINWMLSANDLSPSGGRAPFKRSFMSKGQGFSYFESETLPYALLEITGVGCDTLRSMGIETAVLNHWWNDLTRLDLACDMENVIDPRDFIEGADNERFRTRSVLASETGITVYIGSRQSDRYARVYRYAYPHPRSNLLRCEYVLRSREAKQAAEIILDTGIVSLAEGLGNTFGWKHSSWNLESIHALPRARRENHIGSTERWIIKAVVPALKKLIRDGKDSVVKDALASIIAEINEVESNK